MPLRFVVVGANFLCVLAMLFGCSDGASVACDEMVCPCTEGGIRAAIAMGGGPYTFDCDGPTTVETFAEIIIDEDVILDGEGNLTIAAGRENRVLSLPRGATATLDGITISRGHVVDGNGGGIAMSGTLTLNNSTITGNTAENAPGHLRGRGGGIYNEGTLTLNNSTVAGNTAVTLDRGGHGGGIYNEGTVVLTGSAVEGNTATPSGGGIYSNGTMVLIESRVSENTAEDSGGGIFDLGDMAISNSTVDGNSATDSGGGISSGGAFSLNDSTVSGNTARSGGGIDSWGTLFVSNSTVDDNTATQSGGGIFIGSWQVGAGRVTNSTISGNTAASGANIAVLQGAILSLTYTTTSGGSPGSVADILSHGPNEFTVASVLIDGNCDGDVMSGGYNIESPGNTCGLDLDKGDQVDVADPRLGPLQDNGGPTETHALGEGSVAIDVIPEAECLDPGGAPLTTDQRGRPRPGGPRCDVGSFEVQP
jgi:predicted outer membrane repeat protein